MQTLKIRFIMLNWSFKSENSLKSWFFVHYSCLFLCSWSKVHHSAININFDTTNSTLKKSTGVKYQIALVSQLIWASGSFILKILFHLVKLSIYVCMYIQHRFLYTMNIFLYYHIINEFDVNKSAINNNGRFSWNEYKIETQIFRKK
jgi:hypothetical protein